MSRTINDSEGKEIEVFSADELQEQKQDALDEYKKENPDKSIELQDVQNSLDKAKEELEESNEKLDKLGEKDTNFGKARKEANEKVDEAEKKVADLQASFTEQIGVAKKEILEGTLSDHYNDTLKAIVGDDEESKKRVELAYKTTLAAVVPTTKAEMTKKLIDANNIANPAVTEDAMSTSVISSGGVSRVNTVKDEKSFSSEEQELASKLDLSPEDLKKYGK